MKFYILFKVSGMLSMAMTFTLLLSQFGYAAEGYALLNGFWRCQEGGEQSTLEFKSKTELIYNGQAASYQLLPNAFKVIEASGPVSYYIVASLPIRADFKRATGVLLAMRTPTDVGLSKAPYAKVL